MIFWDVVSVVAALASLRSAHTSDSIHPEELGFPNRGNMIGQH